MTADTESAEPSCIRLVFQLDRADLPLLYDELARFHKGVKRVGRLRTLAYEGLLVQQGVLALPRRAPAGPPREYGFGGDADGITNGIFDPAVDGVGGE